MIEKGYVKIYPTEDCLNQLKECYTDKIQYIEVHSFTNGVSEYWVVYENTKEKIDSNEIQEIISNDFSKARKETFFTHPEMIHDFMTTYDEEEV